MDLIDMGKYKSGPYRYILVVIDAFSRKAYARPLTDKSSDKVSEAFQEVYGAHDLEGMRVIQTDNGGEFDSVLDGFLEGRNIRHIRGIARRPQSQGIAERFNGTLKTLIFQNMLATGSKRWSDDLALLLQAYNETVHSTTEKAPDNVDDTNKKDVESAIRVHATKSGKVDQDNVAQGDKVRRRIFKGALEKASTVNWSRQLYTVSRVIKSKKSFTRTRYRLQDDAGNELANSYARSDIQLVKNVVKPPSRQRLIPMPEEDPMPPPTPVVVPEEAPARNLRQRAPPKAPKPTRIRRSPEEIRKEKEQALAERTAGKLATGKRPYKFQSLV